MGRSLDSAMLDGAQEAARERTSALWLVELLKSAPVDKAGHVHRIKLDGQQLLTSNNFGPHHTHVVRFDVDNGVHELRTTGPIDGPKGHTHTVHIGDTTFSTGAPIAKSDEVVAHEVERRPTTIAARLAEMMPRGRDYVHPFLSKDWRNAIAVNHSNEEAVFILSAPSSDLATPADMVEALKGTTAGWFIECDDTPAARAALKAVGSPFRIDGDSRVFCASFDVSGDDIVKADVSKPFAGYESFDACVLSQTEIGRDGETARRICGALQAEFEKDDSVLKRDILIHKTDEERFVLGIVLEPNDGGGSAPVDPDTQKDVYSSKTVREAAHIFMEDFRNLGLMHTEFVTGAAKILESYLAPVDFTAEDGTKIRKGTWLLAIRVVDDALWLAVKAGKLTGFSIGGSAVRKPV